MAISYVGGQVSGFAGKTGTTTVAFALTGGTNSTPSVGDLVVVTYVVGSTADRALTITTSTGAIAYTLAGSELYSNGTTYDTNLRVAYRTYASGNGTGIILSGTGSTADAGRYTIQVFRGVSQTTPMDATPVTASGTATGRPNPGSIVPVTSGAWVVICGGGAAGTGANYVAPANFTTNFLTGFTADNNDAMVGAGYWSGWTSGAVDPAAYTGGTANAADSWAALTLALRPEPTAYSFDAQPGSFTVSGQAASFYRGLAIDGQPGSFTLTGQDATLEKTSALNNYEIDAQPASFALTGQAAALLAGRALNAAATSFTLTGQAATLLAGRALNAAATSFSVVGQNAELLKATPSPELAADAGAFTLTGQAATLTRQITINAQPGSFVLSGQAAAVTVQRNLSAQPGSFDVLGQFAGLLAGRTLNAQAAEYVPSLWADPDYVDEAYSSGTDASLRVARLLGAASASFTITGRPATFVRVSPYPDPADVRTGVVYGPSGEYTGALVATGGTGQVWLRRR